MQTVPASTVLNATLQRDRGIARLRQAAGAEAQHPYDYVLELAPVDDHVEHPVFEQELAALKTVWQLLADRLLDHARPGKSNQRLRFGDVDVPQHRKACRHP